LVRVALRRERRRGVQSFVVCPRIQDLQPMAERLGQLEPELDLVLAHGRMKGARLDEVMVGFAAGRHDVLLTTDIIEAGLDIPNANTMIVWRADRFGLAQLHQLRGRVGRGARQASTYLLTDPEVPLAPATEQRLRTLEALEALGAGFAIAQRDLDMRGSGDLLGGDQAGHIRLIGTELYQRLLSRALRRVRGEPDPEDCATELHLGLPAAIPAEYVPEPEIRIALYRRLADLEQQAELEDFAAELVDRFGPLPPGADALLTHAEIRLRCCRLGIARLEAGPKAIALEFDSMAHARRVAGALRGGPGEARSADHRVILPEVTAAPEERLQAVRRILDHLEAAE
jgi:transcription-repair coupling factor (superfamily II helicase)